MMSEFGSLVNKWTSRNCLSSSRRSIIDPDHLLLLLLLPLQSASIAVAADQSTAVVAAIDPEMKFMTDQLIKRSGGDGSINSLPSAKRNE